MAAVVGIPAVTCSFCQSNCYTGRSVDSSRLSIVAPTASMSGQDGLNGPAHGIDGELFRPCLCDKYYHRGCFRDMRGGMSYFRHSSYYECPDCMFTYKMERIMGGMKRRQRMDAPLNGGAMTGPTLPNPMGGGGGGDGGGGGFETVNTDELSESAIKWRFRRSVAFMWLTAIIVYVAGSAAVGAIAYGGDGDNKDIPVFIKMLLTSVSFEYPSDESLESWRAEFRRPDVPVWHYYGAFGVFALCLFIILCAMLYYCCCASNMEGGDIRPPLRSFFCCDGDLDEALAVRRSHQQRRINLNGLNPNMAEAVQYSSQKREDELKQYYEEQSKWYHFFSCGRPTSFQYHDHRMDEQTSPQPTYGGNAAIGHNGGMAPAGAQMTYPPQEVMAQPYNNEQHAQQQQQQQQQQQHEQKVEPASTGATTTNYYYTGYNSQYHGNAYYYYYNYSDPCCIQVCCCPSGHRHPKASTCGSCGSCGDVSCGSCDCGDCDCKSSDCNCSGGGGGGGEAVLAVALFVLLIVVIIVIVSAILGSLVFLISRTFRLSSEASQMAYIQALEKEDHVFVLGINETWRPHNTV